MNSQEILAENRIRRAKLFSLYDPHTGVGSLIPRFDFYIDDETKIMLPNSMLNMVGDFQAPGKTMRDMTKSQFFPMFGVLTNMRIREDFEYWASTCVFIQDKITKQDINFMLRFPQRELLSVLIDLFWQKVPIRIILVKARQWGGSTLIQMFIAWLQIFHFENWHSAIVGDVEEQARTIRGMYRRMAELHPKEVQEITFSSFERSTKNLILNERGCIISIGSMQRPEGLRSSDIMMAHKCLAPGTLILTNNGFIKPVEDLLIGDNVITHNGNHAKITAITCSVPTEENGNGEAIKIDAWKSLPITVTPNHPVWTNRGWVRADMLTKKDFLLNPIREIKNTITEYKLDVTLPRKQGGGCIPKGSGMVIPLNKEIGFAFGYYLAEGSIKYQRGIPNSVTFTRHDNEVKYGDRVVLALSPYITSHTRKNRANTLTTLEHFYGSNLARMFHQLLNVKEFKTIPDWFFDCGEDFLIGLLDGYLSGDGSKTIIYQDKYALCAMAVSSVSSSLAMQIRDIAASLGLGWGSLHIREAGHFYNRNCKKRFGLRWTGQHGRSLMKLIGVDVPDNGHTFSEKSFYYRGYIWMRIRSITKTTVSRVYDVEVDHEDHSFRTVSFPVKNSEVASWKETMGKKPEDLIQALSGMPLVHGTLDVEESTAKGIGNYFHKSYLQAVNKESDRIPVFIPWYHIDMYQQPIYNQKDLRIFAESLSEYGQFLWEEGATLEGINWYFWKRRHEGWDAKEDHWRMNAEYPTTAAEAFQSTGRRAFSPIYVKQSGVYACKPEFVGEVFASSSTGKDALSNIIFTPTPNGNLHIWEMPDTEKVYRYRYVVGIDIGGRTDKADYTIIRVLDRLPMLEGGKPVFILTWKGHLDQDLCVWKGAQIAKAYGYGLLVPETNSLDKTESEGDHFLTVLNEIVDYYDEIYCRTSPEQIKQGAPKQYGFHVGHNKTAMIDYYNAQLREVGFIELDQRVINENDSYEIKPNGTYGAVDGQHDDALMCSAECLYVAKDLPLPIEIVRNTKRTTKKIISEATM